MADEEVGRLKASLELDTSKFEKSVSRTEKNLDLLSNAFKKSQQNINGSLRRLNANIVNTTGILSRQINTQTKTINSSLKSIASSANANGANTVNAIKAMQASVVAELQMMRTAFVTFQKATNQDFTKGIKQLAQTTQTNTNAIIGNLQQIQAQAERTKKSLDNQNKSAKVGSKGTTATKGASTPINIPFVSETFPAMSNSINGMFQGISKFYGVFSKVSLHAFILEQAFRQISAVISSMVSPAINFATQMETLRLGYAGIISSTTLKDGKDVPYKEALEISEALIIRMQDEALKTSLTVEELGTALQSAMAMGLNAGMKLDEVLDLTVVAAQAVKTFGLSNQQVIQEIRGLISGEAIRPGVDQLATVLGYTTETVNKLREEGKLYEDIMERMAGFKAASEDFQNTFAGLTSNIQDGISRVAGTAGQAFFEVSKDALKSFQDLFFTIQKTTEKDANGEDKTIFKAVLNENTIELLQSFYNILANVVKVVMQVGTTLGSVLAPVLRIFLDTLEALAGVLVIATTAISPFLEGLSVLGAVLNEVWNALKYMLEPLLESSNAMTALTVIVGGLALAFAAMNFPIIAAIGVIGGIAIAIKNISNPVNAFGFWLESLFRSWEYKFEAIKARLSDITDEKGIAKAFDIKSETARNAAGIYWDSFTSEFKNSVANSGKEIQSYTEDLFKGLNAKYPASKSADGKDKGASKGASKAAKSAYKALEAELKIALETLKEQQRDLDMLYKNDLYSTQNYIEKTLDLQNKQIDAEIQNLEQRKQIAKQLGQESDVERFDNDIATLKEKKVNSEKEAVRQLIEEYKKLDERMDGINRKFEDMAGVSEEAFNTNLIKEFKNEYSRFSAELETAQQRYAQAVEEGKTADINAWAIRKETLEKTIENLNTIVKLKKLEKEADEASAKIRSVDLQIQEQLLSKQNQANRMAYTEADVEGDLFDFRKEHMEEYIDYYTDLIAYNEKMAQMAKDVNTTNEFKSKALEAKQAILELTDAIPPFQKVVKEQFIDSLSNAFQEMLWEGKSAKEALEDFGKSVLQTITKKMFDRVATDITDGIFNAILPEDEKVGNKEVEIDATVQRKLKVIEVDTAKFQENLTTASTSFNEALMNYTVPALQNMTNVINEQVIPALYSVGGGSADGMGKGTDSLFGGLFGGNKEEEENPAETTTETVAEGVADDIKDAGATMQDTANKTANTFLGMDKETFNSTVGLAQFGVSLLDQVFGLGEFGKVLQSVLSIMQVASMFGFGFAEGGYVSGAGTSTSDSIPARLSNGEYVIKASVVKNLGVDFLDRLNNPSSSFKGSGRLPKFRYAEGGYVEAPSTVETQSSTSASSGSVGTPIVMNMQFQSLDPQANMKLWEQQYPIIREKLMRDIDSNTSMRNSIKRATK